MTIIPYPFQKIGARMIEKFDGVALLADGMGLGKTLQALLWVKWFLEAGPVVVICPATVKEHWRREILRVVDMHPKVLEGRRPPPAGLRTSPDRVYVINPDILGKPDDPDSWVNYLRAVKPALVIADEVHYFKSRDALRTKALRHLCQGVEKKIMISGTPMTNRPAELWPVLNILRPDLFDSFWSFGARYCAPKKTPWGWQYSGATNLDELHDILKRTCMIRRLKEEVLKDLPAKTRAVVPMEISKPKEYKEAVENFVKWLRKNSKGKAAKAAKAERLVQMGYLRRLAAELKMPGVLKWIENFLEESDDKLVAFGIHKAAIGEVVRKFGRKCVAVTGEVTGAARQSAIDRFNKDKGVRLFVGNVQAAGVGWSCTATDTVAFFEFPWTPGELTQAEDRVRGIGRGTGGASSLYSLVARGTIEEKLVELLSQKQVTTDRTLDGMAGVSGFDLLDKLTESLMES